MSRIADVGKDLERLPIVLAEYDEHLIDISAILAVKGKIIEEALKEQAAWPIFFDEKRRELITLTKLLEARVASVRSKLFRQYTENSARALTDRTIDKYIDSEPEYLSMNELYLEVKELTDKYEAVMDAFKVRGFALRDVTQLRIAQLHTGTL